MRKKKIFFLFLPFIIYLFFASVSQFAENFKPKNFEHGFKKTYATQVSGLDYSQLDPILSQPFHYLGQGMQMTAFESADGNFVLKLFNPSRPLQKHWYLDWKNVKRLFSINGISYKWFQKDSRLEKLFFRHQIAFSVLREETGLLFVHLFPSDRISHFVHVTDKNGKKHILSLNTTPFVLQKKAVLAATYLDKLMQENKVEEAKEAIARIEQLFAKRLQLGITDKNQTMWNNYGFISNQPIQIDVGKIRIDPILLQQPAEEQKRILDNFHSWLSTRYPGLTGPI